MYFLAGINKARNFAGTVAGFKNMFFEKTSKYFLSTSYFSSNYSRNFSTNHYTIFTPNRYV